MVKQVGLCIALLAPLGAAAKPAGLTATTEPAGQLAPKTPEGLPQCHQLLVPTADLPRGAGESIRYVVDVNGLSVGVIDFRIERQGSFGGQPVTEYRSLFKLDGLLASFVPIEGRAAALVPQLGFAPVAAMNSYKLDTNSFEENVTYSGDGRELESKRVKNGKPKEEQRAFSSPAMDFVSGFYAMRAMPVESHGCTIIYGNQRAYTVWVDHQGRDRVKTPVGMKDADRYAIRYASEKAKEPLSGAIWLSSGADRVPYRVVIEGKDQHLEAKIHLYETAKKR